MARQATNALRIFLVLALAADDVGDVVALVLVGLEERCVVGRIVGDFDFFFLALDRRLLALGLGVGLFERDELDLGGLGDFRLRRREVPFVGVALRIQRINGTVRSANGPGQFMLWEIER